MIGACLPVSDSKDSPLGDDADRFYRDSLRTPSSRTLPQLLPIETTILNERTESVLSARKLYS